MRKSRKLLMLSGVLGLVLAAASARPALAFCHTCFAIDPCTEDIVFGNNVCCSRGGDPICTINHDSNGCVTSVTTACPP